MTDSNFLAIVARSPWFQELPDEALHLLADNASRRSMSVGSYIYQQGVSTTEVFCVLKGRVRVSISSPNGHEFALIEREPETWFGEPGLVSDEGRIVDACVIDPTDLLVIPRDVVLKVGDKWPRMYRNLFCYNQQTLRAMHELVSGILFYPLKARVAGRLLFLLDNHGQQVDDGIMLDIKVSQNDFARLALGSRQRVNKVFRDWNNRGLVETRGDYLLVKDVDLLQQEINLFE
jgi:CRP/FNR family transcriptional regulator, cyclic AMP receptor protein